MIVEKLLDIDDNCEFHTIDGAFKTVDFQHYTKQFWLIMLHFLRNNFNYSGNLM